MRYYSIKISNNGTPVRSAALGGPSSDATYTSYANGQSLPGALNVELDLPVYLQAAPMGFAQVRVWGVSIAEISQANNLNGLDIQIFGGFQKGLPLAKPAQSGLLLKGRIFQAFGNWIGTDQSLDMIVYPDTGSIDDPKNITLQWLRGTQLSDALQNALATAFPGYTISIDISSNLVATEDQVGFYQTLSQFAGYIKDVSVHMLGGDYAGVDIAVLTDTIRVTDGTTQESPTQIAFEDLIGQPTWIDPLTVQFKCPMRADLNVLDYIRFPQAVTTQSAGAVSPLVNAKTIFQGTFRLGAMRHLGNFRQPDAASWVTVMNAFSTSPGAGQ